jgi:hypothetical protein
MAGIVDPRSKGLVSQNSIVNFGRGGLAAAVGAGIAIGRIDRVVGADSVDEGACGALLGAAAIGAAVLAPAGVSHEPLFQ